MAKSVDNGEAAVMAPVGVSPSDKCCADSLSAVCPTPVCIHTHKNDQNKNSISNYVIAELALRTRW